MLSRILFFTFAIAFIFSFTSNSSAENYSKKKLLVRFKSDIRDNPDKLMQFTRNASCTIAPILHNAFSSRYNPKKYFELQANNFNIAEIQKAEEPLLRTFVLEFNYDINPKQLIKTLRSKFPEIELAEPYHTYRILGFTPNDKLINLQTTLENIKAKDAWAIWQGDPETVIGISDNGVNQDHEDLENNIAVNSGEIEGNGKDDDGNGFIDDYRGFNFYGESDGDWGNTFNADPDHGTLVAGIAAADFNNSLGIAGIAGNCRFFPMRTASSEYIEYGYESILYAAYRHFSVLNMSWGGPQEYSELEQSIINYAIANGVALVASGGNIGTNGGTRWDTYYPAGYNGVLGVGEVDDIDMITSSTSCMGVQVDILAPGIGNYATNSWNAYQAASGGTSFASPVVSGAVALARSKYKNLTPLQAIEFVRLCTDDVLAKNNSYGDKLLVPGRLNLLKVVSTDPFSLPSVRPIEYQWYNNSGELTSRFQVGDTVNLKIRFINYLGNANDIKFKISSAYDTMNSLSILNGNASLAYLQTSETALVGNFKFVVKKENTNRIILRLDIECNSGFKDFAKFDFIPTTNFATFESDKIVFSMSDEGDFGFMEIGNKKEGKGFTIKGIGNQLYGDSGLMLSEDETKLVTFDYDNFSTRKKFVKPDPNINILKDDYASTENEIGLEITQVVSFSHPNVAQLDLSIKNVSGRTLKDISLGYFYDWDIEEDADSNVAVLFNEVNNSEFASKFTSLGAELVYKPNTNIFIGCVAFSDESGSQPQIAGLDYDYTQNFTDDKQIKVLNSGMQMQNDRIYDRSVFAGIKLFGEIQPSDSRKISLLIGGNTSRDELKNNIFQALSRNSIEERSSEKEIRILPDPSTGQIQIYLKKIDSPTLDIQFFDLTGNRIPASLINSNISNETINTYQIVNLASQILLVRINTGSGIITEKTQWVE